MDDRHRVGCLHSTGECPQGRPTVSDAASSASTIGFPALTRIDDGKRAMTLPAGWEGSDQNFLGIDEPWCHPDRAGVYVLPAPYEHTSSYIRGSDRGPSAILEA